MVPGGSAPRYSHRCRLLRSPHWSSTFLRSLRSMAVTPLQRYNERSDSCPPDSWALRSNACSTRGQVSLIHALSLPTIPSPTIGGSSALPRHVTYRQVEPRPHPFGTSPNRNSGLRHSLAGSPLHTDRIEFVNLRTGRSPPAAPHPVSPRRSCSRLQVTLTWRGLPPLRPRCALRRTTPGFAVPSPLGEGRYELQRGCESKCTNSRPRPLAWAVL